jgi:hypothetical protein
MISINEDQLATVEYLIKQSTQGNHILFDLETVRKVFSLNTPPMNGEQAHDVEKHIEKIMTLEGFDQRKAYVEHLPEDVLYRVIKIYFNIVENNLFETNLIRH